MSARVAFGLAFMEKILGIVLALIGAALTYYTYINLSAAGIAAGYFIVSGLVLVVVGLILLIAKTG